jgi:hypothetical protein
LELVFLGWDFFATPGRDLALGFFAAFLVGVFMKQKAQLENPSPGIVFRISSDRIS